MLFKYLKHGKALTLIFSDWIQNIRNEKLNDCYKIIQHFLTQNEHYTWSRKKTHFPLILDRNNFFKNALIASNWNKNSQSWWEQYIR